MPPKDRLYKPAYANELLLVANNDLIAARALKQHSEVRGETVLIMVQQSIEKGLNALLCAMKKPIPMTHDLYGIVVLLGDNEVPPRAAELEELTPYATIRRYEEGRFEITQEDISNAIGLAEEVVEWCGMSKHTI